MCILSTFCFNCLASLYQLFTPHTLIFSNSIIKKEAMKSHKTSSSTRFSPILSPLPLPQHLDVQPPTYHKIPPAFRPPSTRRQNILLHCSGKIPSSLRKAVPPASYCGPESASVYSAAESHWPW